jgi:hypothetical protein
MEVLQMRIRPKETFEQTHQRLGSNGGGAFGTVDFLKFTKNQVYEFYIVPKVVSIDLAADECEIDYPFAEINTHFGTYDFMQNYASMKPVRINCTGCAIDTWMAETRLPKTIFKIAVPTKFFISYIIHEKKIKIAFFQDYLYAILMERIAKLMTDKELNLIDALRHRIKLFTNPQNKLDIEVNADVAIPAESQGFKTILVSVNEKPLDKLIDQQITCDPETIDAVLHALKDYTEDVIKAEKDKSKAERMEEKSKQFEASLEGFKKDSDYKPGGNEPFIEGVGPESEPAVDDDIPF